MSSTLIYKMFEFRLVKYAYPECKEVKSLMTPTSSIINKGLALISISEGTVCKHSFWQKVVEILCREVLIYMILF